MKRTKDKKVLKNDKGFYEFKIKEEMLKSPVNKTIKTFKTSENSTKLPSFKDFVLGIEQ